VDLDRHGCKLRPQLSILCVSKKLQLLSQTQRLVVLARLGLWRARGLLWIHIFFLIIECVPTGSILLA
jgi:hypothetical protein